ncbi:kinase-like protein [Thelephora ganbajun]|uniref:Kinase-like protein n=1 Tax=Thelephora ganbajun TaxID=370292 RepID=A0ACB6ZFW1_THEGA|nr:kinase-like protein [Thelephora ganbajun]
MINGNIMDFTLKHPEVNRLRLLAEAASGLQYLHSIGVIHGNLKPANILIDRDCHPRLADYGVPLRPDVVEGEFHRYGDLQYPAPELLESSITGLKNKISTKENDIFAFGTTICEVLTGQQPSPGVKHSISHVVTGKQPQRPPNPNELVPSKVWDLISRCWSTHWGGRPDASLVMNTLDDAGDVVEFRRREPALVAFLDTIKARARDSAEVSKAQELVDMVDSILDNGDLAKRTRKQYLKHLRKLCFIFAILPSSFTLASALDTREAAPFDSGGFSDVYKATFGGRPMVIKTLRFTSAADPKRVHRLVKEVVGWKWLRHDNILPFVGVLHTPPLISIVSEQMENGNIMNFVRSHPKYNRLHLLADAVTGLEYLHEYSIVHGDLKGANILIDSNCRARLADFGLSVVIDESTTEGTINNRGIRGTIRWMAPELMCPEKFGFDGEERKRLPSRTTDTYALGMTVLEVLTSCRPFNNIARDVTVMYKVLQGERPERPCVELSDQLWTLLETSWHVEHRSQPSGRPPTSTVLNRLEKDAPNWGKSSIQLSTLARPQKRCDVDSVNGRSENDTDRSHVVQRKSRGTGILARLKRFFCLYFFDRLLGSLMRP